MPNDNIETILTLISGNLTLFNKQLEKQNKVIGDLADAVKNQKITVTAPDVKVNFADLKVPAINVPPIQIPKIQVPKAQVEVKIPPIRVPEARVTVEMPKIPAPIVHVESPKVIFPDFPKEIVVKDLEMWFQRLIEIVENNSGVHAFPEFSQQSPMPVVLIDTEGQAYKARGGGAVGIASGGGSTEPPYNPIGYLQMTVSTAAVSISNIPDGALRAVITVENDTIRWRDDGKVPTSSSGMPAVSLESFELPSSGSIANFQAIRDAAATSDVLLNISFYKR